MSVCLLAGESTVFFAVLLVVMDPRRCTTLVLPRLFLQFDADVHDTPRMNFNYRHCQGRRFKSVKTLCVKQMLAC